MKFVLVSILVVVGCTDRPEPPPATDGLACGVRYLVCQRPGEAPLLDGTDPLWTFCHRREPIATLEALYGSGVAEVTWAYADDGGIERVEVQCLEEGPISLVPERDELGRVIRWNESGGWTTTTELTYDDAGTIATSTLEFEQFEVVTSLAYEGEGRLAMRRSESWYQGQLDTVHIVALTYDGADLVALGVSGGDPCSTETGFVREEGRLVEISEEKVCRGRPASGRSERRYEWSEGQMVRSTWDYGRSAYGEWTEWEEELRYRYEGGRVVEVERDRDGEPYATYWYDYDDVGRPVHLLWWGHVAPPPPVRL